MCFCVCIHIYVYLCIHIHICTWWISPAAEFIKFGLGSQSVQLLAPEHMSPQDYSTTPIVTIENCTYAHKDIHVNSELLDLMIPPAALWKSSGPSVSQHLLQSHP